MKKGLRLQAKGAVRSFGEIPQREIFARCECVIKILDSKIKIFLGSLL